MAVKYIIHSSYAPPRFPPVGKFTTVDLRGNCLGCLNCVKDACIYQVYVNELSRRRKNLTYTSIDYTCMNCLRCVQECRSGLLERVVNPEYKKLGDSYYTPEIISRIWNMAETGRIPVSGAGYGGPFVGSGFDSMWTDFSEIVRPTRDGIHGREYISTSADIGRKPQVLTFDENGKLQTESSLPMEIPLPILFKTTAKLRLPCAALEACVMGAQTLGTKMMVDSDEFLSLPSVYHSGMIPLINAEASDTTFLSQEGVRIVELPYSSDSAGLWEKIRWTNPDTQIIIRLPDGEDASSEAVRLAKIGVGIFHLPADSHGKCGGKNGKVFILDRISEIHLALVEACCRDEVTLIVSGGIAMAEHMAKSIIVGADLVAVDLPLPVALECRLCRECKSGQDCPVDLERLDKDWGAQRIVNLIGAWHGQLIEVLGAMGLREVRRLRGEIGRAMFFEDLEKETFGKMFA